MAKRMLIDATHAEETRVVVMNGTRLEEFDVETSTKKQLKGNIYLAKIVRVEPSLQAAFVDYGGNRHGFLAFSEIHPDYYQIPKADRQALLAEQREVMRQSATAAAADFGDADDGEDAAGFADAPADEAAAESFPAEAVSPAAEDGAEDGTAPAPAVEAVPLFELAAGEDLPAESPEAGTGQPVEIGGEDVVGEPERRRKPLRSYKIQEVIKRRQIVLVQVVKEERGNKGAALTTYLSLAGRYCVLMPNTARGGGVSRKITNLADRKRLKAITNEMEIPDGMAVIVRTAGSERTKPEIKRDYEYLLRLWDSVRGLTLRSTAPALVYEEANLIKRSIRDLYSRDIDEILVDGEEGYQLAKDFMRMLTPSHTSKVQLFREHVPLLHKFGVENQLDAMHSPVVQLRSGGYLVINQTEALVAIDVNSGRSTKERHIEETALKTNLEAADEVARQLRLRDLAGLIVIDFIDMEEPRNNHQVERRLKEAMRFDRARIQLGRISPFGLMELSRQRLRPSLMETSFQPCPHCGGTGLMRSVESASMHVLRAIEEEGLRRRSSEITVTVHPSIALYILNQKRAALGDMERSYGCRVFLAADDALIPPAFRMERLKAEAPIEAPQLQRPVNVDLALPDEVEEEEEETVEEEAEEAAAVEGAAQGEKSDEGDGRRRRRRRRRRGRREEGLAAGGEEGLLEEGAEEAEDEAAEDGAAGEAPAGEPVPAGEEEPGNETEGDETEGDETEGDGEDEDQEIAVAEGEPQPRRRRRGKRGGRRRHRGRDGALPPLGEGEEGEEEAAEGAETADASEAGAAEGDAAVALSETVVPGDVVVTAVPAETAAETPAPSEYVAVVEVPVAPAQPAEEPSVAAAEPAAPEVPASEVPAPVTEAVAPAVTEEVAAAPAEAAAPAAEVPVEAPPAKPKRTRTRKKPAAEAAPAEAQPVEAAPAEATPAAGEAAPEAPPAKPKRPRTRKKPVAEAAPVEAPPVEAKPVEAQAVEIPVPEAAPEATAAPQPIQPELPLQAEPAADDPTDGRPRRRGWWNRAG